MGFKDILLGRTKPKPPNLDKLFGISDAALTLTAAGMFAPTGVGAVCYRAGEGGAFATTQTDVQQLLDVGLGGACATPQPAAQPRRPADGGPAVERSHDEFGFTWLTVRHDPDDLAGLVTDVHAVNTVLTDAGFGSLLLCTLVAFRGVTGSDQAGRPLGLVYLYKRGTFYPFAPTGAQARDSALELQVRAQIGADLTMEADLSRWFAVWGAPGL
jgi:hypothetical protein